MNRNNLRSRFINKLIRDESKGNQKYKDTNAGFRKFLKDLGVTPFNFKNGGRVKKKKPLKNGYLKVNPKKLKDFERLRKK